MDPITTAIVAAITTGIAGMAEPAKEVGKKMAVDAYEALKALIKEKFGDDSNLVKAVTELEGEPDFKPNQEALCGRIAQVKAAEDTEILQLASTLFEALKKTSEGEEALSKYKVKITDSQVGIVGDNANVEGGIHFGDVHTKFSVKADRIDNLTQADRIENMHQHIREDKEDETR